ncbi:GMC family oxidoreductase [Paraburkholderia sacchari]|uniref:GMC family oxidoreductase n=1 Tax=Paraburkholderia sacchari TaxID=159450 RepID=UPI0005422EF4|nr:GMC family oxidoreductase N-terminal domain-containing protein [Paraburkholderia sacchari]NLP62596.1 GMC family oxidoreductase [Paraburkholderia sacchari]
MIHNGQKTPSPSSAGEFDYIVVGAGSAGCAVASRLAGDEGVTVALLEAGPHDHHYTVWTPIGIAKTAGHRGLRNYGYYSEPQSAMGGRRSWQPRGRGLGGSSSINAMVYIRGHRRDYDHWAELGCNGWGYEDVLPYFRRSECNERYAGRDDDPWHGGTGPLYVSDLRTPNPFSRRFLEAAQQAGVRLNPDFNGETQEGAGLFQVTQHNGERWNAARAYLHRADASDAGLNGGRKGLAVLTDTQALRICFEGRRAVGVTVVRGGVEQTLRARREVIVSGGAYNSPQLLMASGIGPASHLRGLGIGVVHDLPGVGENLHDHPDIVINKQVDSTDLFGYSMRGFARMFGEVLRYRRHRTGMVASNIAEAGAFVKSHPDLAEPDLQLHFTAAMVGERGEGKTKPPHGYSCHACVLRPHSRGHVRLSSGDMRDAPIIDARLLSDARDMEGLVAGVKLIRRIFAQPALAREGGREIATEAFGADNRNDDAIRTFVRTRAETVFHPVGTCRMGVDEMAVVDPQLRVRGVAGLRVVDASIMPTVPAGNTNAPAIMVGEKAADMIRNDAR